MVPLNKEDKCWAFDYQCRYEQEVRQFMQHFDIDAPAVQEFCAKNDIFLGKLNKNDRKEASKHPNYCLFEQTANKKKQPNDVAHHFLRHMRNCCGHGYLAKESKGVFLLTDKFESGKTSMEGKMNVSVLKSLVETIIQTKH